MSEWEFAQANAEQQLAAASFFDGEAAGGRAVEFTITVKQFLTPKDPAMSYFAQADKQTNQGVAPYTPVGWGKRCCRRWRSACARWSGFLTRDKSLFDRR